MFTVYQAKWPSTKSKESGNYLEYCTANEFCGVLFLSAYYISCACVYDIMYVAYDVSG